MKCKHCKNDIPDNSIFYLYCGVPKKNDPATAEVAGLFFYFTNGFTNNKGFLFFVKRVIERALLFGSKGVERVDVLLYSLFLQARNCVSACVLAVCIIVELVDIKRDGVGYFHTLRSFGHISEPTIAVLRGHVFTHFFNKLPA